MLVIEADEEDTEGEGNDDRPLSWRGKRAEVGASSDPSVQSLQQC